MQDVRLEARCLNFTVHRIPYSILEHGKFRLQRYEITITFLVSKNFPKRQGRSVLRHGFAEIYILFKDFSLIFSSVWPRITSRYLHGKCYVRGRSVSATNFYRERTLRAKVSPFRAIAFQFSCYTQGIPRIHWILNRAQLIFDSAACLFPLLCAILLLTSESLGTNIIVTTSLRAWKSWKSQETSIFFAPWSLPGNSFYERYCSAFARILFLIPWKNYAEITSVE